MILESIFNVLFGAVTLLLSFLPNIEWTVNTDMFTKFFEVLKLVCYFLPMTTVGAIFTLVIAINLFKIAVALLKFLLDILPFF